MSDVIVGVDPHKRSATIEAIDGQGKEAGKADQRLAPAVLIAYQLPTAGGSRSWTLDRILYQPRATSPCIDLRIPDERRSVTGESGSS